MEDWRKQISLWSLAAVRRQLYRPGYEDTKKGKFTIEKARGGGGEREVGFLFLRGTVQLAPFVFNHRTNFMEKKTLQPFCWEREVFEGQDRLVDIFGSPCMYFVCWLVDWRFRIGGIEAPVDASSLSEPPLDATPYFKRPTSLFLPSLTTTRLPFIYHYLFPILFRQILASSFLYKLIDLRRGGGGGER